ncbi:MAG: DUF2079 domain-containing protein [Anaerolineae bacterium]
MTSRRIFLFLGGLALLGSAAALGCSGLRARAGAGATPQALFALSSLGEARLAAALLGSLLLLLALWPPPLQRAWVHGVTALERTDRWLAGPRWLWLLSGCVLLAAAGLAAYSIARHNAFNSKAYDLGLHAQVWWNTSHGRLFASSVEVDNYLGDHVSPIILPLALFYRLWPDPRLLLALQAVALAAGAWPLALLARRRLWLFWPRTAHLAALLLALVYLTYPALGFINRFEFHEEVLAVPLLLAAFYWLDSGRTGWMSVALALTLLVKEDAGLTVAAFGAWIWWRSRGEPRARLGLLWAAAGTTWSLVALFVVIPALRGDASDTLARYAWLGSAWRQPARLVPHLLDPLRGWMLIKFLLPVGFTALLSPAVLVALPALLINWLASNLYQATPYFHYATLLLPGIFAAAVYGLERLAARRVRPAAALLWVAVCVMLAIGFDPFWQTPTGQVNWENGSLARQTDPAAFRAVAAGLPADAAVATTEAYAAHLANRQELYLLHDPRILNVADRVDWVLVDLNDTRYGARPRQLYGLLRWIAERRGLGVHVFAGDVVLLGPGEGDAAAGAAYAARLGALQRAHVGDPLDAGMAAAVGAKYFEPVVGE